MFLKTLFFVLGMQLSIMATAAAYSLLDLHYGRATHWPRIARRIGVVLVVVSLFAWLSRNYRINLGVGFIAFLIFYASQTLVIRWAWPRLYKRQRTKHKSY